MPIGRYIRAVGSNPDAARLSGIRVGRYTFSAMVICSTVAGVAGVMYASNVGPSLSFGNALLLPAYAAAFLGFTQIVPGQFNVIGTLNWPGTCDQRPVAHRHLQWSCPRRCGFVRCLAAAYSSEQAQPATSDSILIARGTKPRVSSLSWHDLSTFRSAKRSRCASPRFFGAGTTKLAPTGSRADPIDRPFLCEET
jgi:Branched-chain amino acid transport system / permease component